MAFGRTGDATREQRLVEVGHLDDLVFDVAGLGGAVVLGGQGGGADEHVAHADLAAAVALAVIAGEALHQRAGELDLAAQIHAVPGHENVLEDHQGFLAAEAPVAHVQLVVLEFAGVAALAPVDVADAGRVGRRAEADGVVLIAGSHGDGRHDQDLVRVTGAGLVGLGAADNDTVVAALDDVEVHVRVRLLARCQAAVSLDVRHGAVGDDVVLLQELHVRAEAGVVVSALGLVDVVGGGVEGVDGVHADAALEAGAGLLAQKALHLHLLHQVLGRLVDVGEAVDLLAGEMARGQHEVFVFRLRGQFVGHGHAVEAGPDQRMFRVVVDLLAEDVDLQVEVGHALDVLLGCLERHAVSLLTSHAAQAADDPRSGMYISGPGPPPRAAKEGVFAGTDIPTDP